MINYLTSIAARALQLPTPVRPRLRSLFDPPASDSEGSLVKPSLLRAISPKPLHSESETQTDQSEKGYQSAPKDRSEKQESKLHPDDLSNSREAQAPNVLRPIEVNTTELQPSLPSPIYEPRNRLKPSQRFDNEPATVTNLRAEDNHKSTRFNEPAKSQQPGPPSIGELRKETERDPVNQVELQPKVYSIPTPPGQSLAKPDAPSSSSTGNREPVIQRQLQTVATREQYADGSPRESRLDSSKLPSSVVTAPNRITPRNLPGEAIAVPAHVGSLASLRGSQLPLRQSPRAVEPVVHVTIGRIEVRAVQHSQPAVKPKSSQPAMSLDDYLRNRRQGSTR